jgi:hypothetical protein
LGDIAKRDIRTDFGHTQGRRPIDSRVARSSIRGMPTILRVGPYRFYFYSHDLVSEPPHVHVDRDDLSAKFWLEPVSLPGISASARPSCGASNDL